ncbi:PspA/IM30 family protein [Vreelandella venusta]|uniref:Phage shock protein A n=1 Tax=Vreelandella venusta TaxID=44935 RepID=A0AAP9ZFD7_9GAMM|nr:PspA/IM30 family protein [Halomonas venusta]MBR9925051.1 PspA/IM30 family protein [Gammaproteobacteria bacterium]AZM94592.1 PspA/IM30 family protein [Halomonas venusta]MDW0359431.1 PspA/IM30 family protein [Halomonas venusta]MDX1354799.1 PspA/IM30 family protein [Halomonas venusta]MDX1712836.1 PspA/IM30 family protein [Halomonas venusta]
MLLRKMFTALRGKATETGEAIVDSQGIRIMEQELRDAKAAMNQANEELTTIMARRNLAAKEVDTLSDKMAEYEKSAMAALEKGEQSLAEEVAGEIARLEGEREVAQANVTQYDGTIDALKSSIAKSKGEIRRVEQQMSHVKATEAAQKAQAAVASQHAGQNASMNSAVASLERIKERQALQAEKLKIGESMQAQDSGADLEARLAQAGIGKQQTSGSDVLARLKAKQNAGN